MSEIDELQKRIECLARTDKAAEKIRDVIRTHGKNTFSIQFLKNFIGETSAHDIRRYENLKDRPPEQDEPYVYVPLVKVVKAPVPVAVRPPDAALASSDALEEHTANHEPVQVVENRLLGDENRLIAVPHLVESRLPVEKPETEQSQDVTVEQPTSEIIGENRGLSIPQSVTSPSSEEILDVTLVDKSDTKRNNPSNVRNRRHGRNPWAGYARPETAPTAKVILEPVPMPPRAVRTVRPTRSTVPEYVKDAKIAQQGDCCTWCQRPFGSPVLHNGEVVVLSPEAEHFKPVAGKGKTTDSNLNYACNVCNRLKGSYLFSTVAELIDFLDREFLRRGYSDCPPLIPFNRTAAERVLYPFAFAAHN